MEWISLGIWFLFCFGVASLWRSKGRSFAGGFWCSFFLTPLLGFIIGLCLARVAPQDASSSHLRLAQPEAEKARLELTQSATDAQRDEEPIWQYKDQFGATSAMYSAKEILARMAEGRTTRNVMVWTAGADKWRPASDYAAFANKDPSSQAETLS